MINSLTLQYFQSHKSSRLVFDKGINVISGQSDKGKSSIIRAIRLVVENKPAGDSYCSSFAKKNDTIVSIVAGSDKVSRVKGKENKYTINNEDYKAMGQSVPEEVTTALNILPVNIQYQMDSPFLLSSNDGEVAKYLRKVARLDIIDKATSSINSQILSNKEKLGMAEYSFDTATTDLKKYENLQSLEDKLKEAEEIEIRIKKLEEEHRAVCSLISSIESLQKRKETAKEFLSRIKIPTKTLFLDINELDSLQYESNKLQQIIDSIRSSKRIIDENKKIPDLSPQIKSLKNIVEEAKQKNRKLSALNLIVANIELSKSDIKALIKRKATANDEYLKAIPETCPTCNQIWKR